MLCQLCLEALHPWTLKIPGRLDVSKHGMFSFCKVAMAREQTVCAWLTPRIHVARAHVQATCVDADDDDDDRVQAGMTQDTSLQKNLPV